MKLLWSKNLFASLRFRLIAPIVLIIAAGAGYVGVIMVPTAINSSVSRAIDDLDTFTDVISEGLFPLLVGGELSNIYDQLDILQDSLDFVVDVQLFDQDGASVYPLVSLTDLPTDERFVVFTKDIGAAGNMVGTLQLLIDTKVISKPINSEFYDSFVTMLAFIIALAIALVFSMIRLVTDPLFALRQVMERTADRSKKNVPVPKFRIPEYQELADSFSNARNELEAVAIDLRHARDQANAANQAKSDFLSNMSHELRTPLTGVMGITELLVSQETETSKKDLLLAVHNSGQRLLSQLNDILDVSRIEAGDMPTYDETFDIKSMVDEHLILFRPNADSKGLKFAFDCKQTDTLITADQGKLSQVLGNLLNNAVKFTATGAITVTLWQEEVAGRLIQKCSVADTGIGIQPQHLRTVFEKFSQEDETVNRRFGGSGLGLTICRNLLTLLGGEIDVESTVGQGSKFTLWFPTTPATASVVEAAKVEAAPIPKDLLTDLKILVADDEPINQMFISRILERTGVTQSVLVENGALAVQACAETEFDVVLMDCQMPEVDGFSATTQIRAMEQKLKRRAVRIFALTANAMPKTEGRCLEAGMDGMMTKPIALKVLHNFLEQVAAEKHSAGIRELHSTHQPG